MEFKVQIVESPKKTLFKISLSEVLIYVISFLKCYKIDFIVNQYYEESRLIYAEILFKNFMSIVLVDDKYPESFNSIRKEVKYRIRCTWDYAIENSSRKVSIRTSKGKIKYILCKVPTVSNLNLILGMVICDLKKGTNFIDKFSYEGPSYQTYFKNINWSKIKEIKFERKG